MRSFFLAALTLAACERSQAPKPDPAATSQAPSLAARTLVFSPAPAGEAVEAVVQREREIAQREGQKLVVYVGATWCEPCQRFHHAAEQGELEGKLPPIRFVEFDLDRDSDRLKAASYRSKYIPLFALPADDGRSSGKQVEGGIKGPNAATELTGRLNRLFGP